MAQAVANLYASALASAQLREFARGERALAAARAVLGRLGAAGNSPFAPADQAATQRALDSLGVQLALAAGTPERAQAQLDALAPDDSRSDLLLRAEADLASGTPAALRQCTEALQTWVAEHRRDSSGWQLLGQCANRQGLALRALRAEAETQAYSTTWAAPSTACALGNCWPGAVAPAPTSLKPR